MTKNRLLVLALLVFGLSGVNVVLAEQLIVYSGENDPALKEAAKRFTKQTQVNVLIKTDKPDVLLKKLEEDGVGSQAGLFITNDVAYLERGRAAGLFQATDFLREVAANVSIKHRAEDDSWIGLVATTWVLVVNRASSDAMQVTSVLELADPKWKGRIAVPDMLSADFLDAVSAYRERLGDEKVKAWLIGLKENSDGAVVNQNQAAQSVISAKKDIAWLRLSDYYSTFRAKAHSSVVIALPDQGAGGLGVVWTIKGVGVVNVATQSNLAVDFIEFLLSGAGQTLFGDMSSMYPLDGVGVVDPNMPNTSGMKIVDLPLSFFVAKREETLGFVSSVLQP